MPRLLSWRSGAAMALEDPFVVVGDDEPIAAADVIVSRARLEGADDALWRCRRLGVRLLADEPVEALAPFLPRLATVTLEFPKFKDGRAYSGAAILRGRFGYRGEVRAVGEVLREQAGFMVRAGFDAFIPADGSTAADWTVAARRYRHVYQRAADGRPAAFEERLDRAQRRMAA